MDFGTLERPVSPHREKEDKMKKSFTKPVLLFALIIFLLGILFGIIGSALGGNVFRASANINHVMGGNSVIKFEFSTPEPTAVPYTDPFEEFFGSSDIFDIFEEFGMGEDFMMPYGGYSETIPGNSGKIY